MDGVGYPGGGIFGGGICHAQCCFVYQKTVMKEGDKNKVANSDANFVICIVKTLLPIYISAHPSPSPIAHLLMSKAASAGKSGKATVAVITIFLPITVKNIDGVMGAMKLTAKCQRVHQLIIGI